MVTATIILFMRLIGASQGCIGAMVWRGGIYELANGQALPGVLGATSAAGVGALGGVLIASAAVNSEWIRHNFRKNRSTHLHSLRRSRSL